MKKPFSEVLGQVEFLLRRYSNEFRGSVQPYRYDIQREMNPNYHFDPEDRFVRESLIEHVGVLPILATFFHSHVTESINLGKCLEMLAIHDIGELAIGDESVFTKRAEQEEEETREALNLLDRQYHDTYLEFKEGKTNEAKFASSIDKIAPDIFDYLTDKEVSVVRFKHFARLEPHEIVPTIEKVKSPYMQWSDFFREFHAGLMQVLYEKFSQ